MKSMPVNNFQAWVGPLGVLLRPTQEFIGSDLSKTIDYFTGVVILALSMGKLWSYVVR